jgi:DNA-binding NarL/FixJ family response regulator
MRNRRLFMEQLEARDALLAREREEEAQRAVAQERLRIAQELHDVVAHSMGVIAVQAGVGAHVIGDDPAEAKRSLEAISTTSRASLAEIRRLLGALRADGDAGYEPAPGLADVERLVADLSAAGLDVTLSIDGTRCDLPPGVDLTAFRIVQEALTNVLKHAGPARACVTVGYEPGALHSAPDIDVVGEAANGVEAVNLVTRERPDVVLMDIRMPEMDGLVATCAITNAGIPTSVLILTTFDLDEYVYGALRAGASGFLLKDTMPEDLLAAVRVVASGDALLAPRVTRRLIEQFAQQPGVASPEPHPGIASLTERESEVLGAVARGLSNAEIAEELFMSHATAKTHVSHLLTKLDARDRAQLVVIAYESGVVTPGARE